MGVRRTARRADAAGVSCPSASVSAANRCRSESLRGTGRTIRPQRLTIPARDRAGLWQGPPGLIVIGGRPARGAALRCRGVRESRYGRSRRPPDATRCAANGYARRSRARRLGVSVDRRRIPGWDGSPDGRSRARVAANGRFGPYGRCAPAPLESALCDGAPAAGAALSSHRGAAIIEDGRAVGVIAAGER